MKNTSYICLTFSDSPFGVYLSNYSPPSMGSPMLIISEYVSGGKGVGL